MRHVSVAAVLLLSGAALPVGAAAQEQIQTQRTGQAPPDSLWRIRLDPSACGAPVPLVRATSSGEVRDTVFTANMVDRIPEITRLEQPHYPPDMTRGDHDAFVVLSVLVEASGRPSRVMVARSSRSRGVDGAIRESVARSYFRPALRGTRQVAVMLCQTVAVSTVPEP